MAEPTVLVVDDSPTVRKIVQMTLQREHIRVITASDGLSALTSVADEMPAVILLDIQLPRMDGYHICQIIRKNLQFRQIPIIMLSGKDGLFDKMRGRLAGSTEYLTKPFDSGIGADSQKTSCKLARTYAYAARRYAPALALSWLKPYVLSTSSLWERSGRKIAFISHCTSVVYKGKVIIRCRGRKFSLWTIVGRN